MDNYNYFLRLNEQLRKSIEPIIKFQSTILPLTQQLGAIYSQIYQPTIEIQQMISNFNNSVNQTFIGIRKQVEGMSDRYEQFKIIVIEFGYPPHYDIAFGEVNAIVNAYKKLSKEEMQIEIDEFFACKFNNETIKNMFNKWEKFNFLKNRINIIQQIIIAHFEGKYSLIIPIIFSQIEGLIAEAFNHVGYMSGEKLKKYLDELLSENKTFSLDNSIKEFYLNIVLVAFFHGQKIESILSRNAIIHGADYEYGTLNNSIRSLLLFDYICDG